MALVWADAANFLLTLTGGPTSYSTAILTIPAALSNTRQVFVSVAIDAIPNTGLGPSGSITLEVRDASAALLASAPMSAGTGAASVFQSTGALASAGGTIRIAGTFTSATQVFAGRVSAAIDDAVIAGSEVDLPYVSGNNDAVGHATGSFDTTEFDGFGSAFILKALYGLALQYATVETLTVQHSLVAATPSGFVPTFSGAGWTFQNGDYFDPYTSTASGTDPAPHLLSSNNVTIISSGVMPANPSFVRTVWSASPSGGIGGALYGITLEARNSGGGLIGTIDSRTMASTTETFNLGGVAPAGTASVTAQLTAFSSPNNMQFSWTYYVYCNSMTSPHYYATALYSYGGVLTGTINYDALYLSTTLGADPHALSSSFWGAEGAALIVAIGGSRSRAIIIA